MTTTFPAIVDDSLHASSGLWELDSMQFVASSRPSTVGLVKEGKSLRRQLTGNGAVAPSRPLSASPSASCPEEASRQRRFEGKGRPESHGACGLRLLKPLWAGASTDVIEASARACLNAVNRFIRMEKHARPRCGQREPSDQQPLILPPAPAARGGSALPGQRVFCFPPRRRGQGEGIKGRWSDGSLVRICGPGHVFHANEAVDRIQIGAGGGFDDVRGRTLAHNGLG